MTRHNFSPKDKELLAKRVGYHCSNPACGVSTIGPSNNADDAEYVGVAAHIYSASVDKGPRANPNLTEAERSSIANAIHLCNKCSTLIDKNNGAGYSAEVLFGWKAYAEKKAKHRIYSVNTVTLYKKVDFTFLEKDYSTALSCTGLNEKNVESCPTNEPILTDVKNKLNLANKCVIRGCSGSGKSLLTYQVAHNFYKDGYVAFNINKDSISKDFILVTPKEKSILVIDDAQIIEPQYLEEILSNAHKGCLVLANWNSSTSIDDGFLRNFPCIDISLVSQVKMIEKYCLENKDQIGQTLNLIGLNTDMKDHHKRIEARIFRAALEHTPWLFNYSLTEGWNSAKRDLEILENDQNLSLVIVTVAIFQLSTLDKGVDEQVILMALRGFRSDKEWLIKASKVINKYCISIDGNIKNRHYEYARRILQKFLSQKKSNEEFKYLIILIASILKSDIYFNGHANLLNFIKFDFWRGQYELNQNGVIEEITLSLLENSASINEKPAMVNNLDSLIGFNKKVLDHLENFNSVLEGWILKVCRKTAYPLGNLLNTLHNKKYCSVTISQNHVKSIFTSLFEAHSEDKPRFAYLLNRMQFFVNDEIKVFEKDLLIKANFEVNISSFYDETICFQFSKLINDLYCISEDWADVQIKNNIERISQLMNKDLMKSYSSFRDLINHYFGVIHAILEIPLNDTRRKKRARSLASKLDVESILRAFDSLEVIDIQNYCNILIFLGLYDKKKLKLISDRFNYDKLFKFHENDEELDHYHRGLIGILQNHDSINYQNYVTKIILKYNYVDELFIALSPQFSLEKIKNGMRYKMYLRDSSERKNELIILKEIMKEDNGEQLVKKILEENLPSISETIFDKSMNIDNSKSKLMLLTFIHSVLPELFYFIFEDKERNYLLIEKIRRLIKGKSREKEHARLYTYLLKNFSDGHISQITEIEKSYPSISRFDFVHFK